MWGAAMSWPEALSTAGRSVVGVGATAPNCAWAAPGSKAAQARAMAPARAVARKVGRGRAMVNQQNKNTTGRGDRLVQPSWMEPWAGMQCHAIVGPNPAPGLCFN